MGLLRHVRVCVCACTYKHTCYYITSIYIYIRIYILLPWLCESFKIHHDLTISWARLVHKAARKCSHSQDAGPNCQTKTTILFAAVPRARLRANLQSPSENPILILLLIAHICWILLPINFHNLCCALQRLQLYSQWPGDYSKVGLWLNDSGWMSFSPPLAIVH